VSCSLKYRKIKEMDTLYNFEENILTDLVEGAESTVLPFGERSSQGWPDRKELNNFYYINMTFRDDQVIKLDLKVKKIHPKTNLESGVKISFIDSLNILSGSLEQLAKDYNVETQKGRFPYSFVNRNNLNYSGKVPSI
jgi:hypothetical protein